MIEPMLARLAACLLCLGLLAALVTSADASRETAAANSGRTVITHP